MSYGIPISFAEYGDADDGQYQYAPIRFSTRSAPFYTDQGNGHYAPLHIQNQSSQQQQQQPSVPRQPDFAWKLEVKHIDEVRDASRGGLSVQDSDLYDIPGINMNGAEAPDPYVCYPFTVNHAMVKTLHRSADGTTMETKKVESTRIEIRSPYLKSVGKKVIGDIQGISWAAQPLKIEPNIFLAQFSALKEHLSSLESQMDPTPDHASALSHLSLLIGHLKSEYASTLAEISNLLENKEIRFDLLWAILVPRTIFCLTCPTSEEPRAARLLRYDLTQSQEGVPLWALKFEFVEWFAQKALTRGSRTPEHFGYATLPSIKISQFKGTLKIRRLPTYPLEYHGNADELRASLIARGRKWAGLQGVHHMQYDGIAIDQGQVKASIGRDAATIQAYTVMATGLRERKVHTSGRIIIDRRTYGESVANNHLPRVVRDLDEEDIDPHLEEVVVKEDGPRKLADDEALMTSPVVYGFSLVNKKWLVFKVKDVSAFKWNETVFDDLVLPSTQKTLVRSLVMAHRSEKTNFDDFIAGKGKGLVINIFGNPGVGKSLTAEATSEHLKKPLYVVGAGDLGTQADVLDANLSEIFRVSTRWGAVVLIDEADVFLEQRSLHNLERNAMVAVFLRQLEYFRGILFLTTNRVQAFDVAFQSRIHVALHYQDLTEDAKQRIWIGFMRKALAALAPCTPTPSNRTANGISNGADADAPSPPSAFDHETAGFTDDQLAVLRKKNVNGRQIKNVVRTASAIAGSLDEPLAYRHLVQVLDIMGEFDITAQVGKGNVGRQGLSEVDDEA